jgi:hypothetical protein
VTMTTLLILSALALAESVAWRVLHDKEARP